MNSFRRTALETLPYGALALALVLLDRLTKDWCDVHLNNYDRIPVIGSDWLTLTKVLNRGIVGDRFSSLPPGTIEYYTRYLPTAALASLAMFAASRLRRARPPELGSYLLLGLSGASNLWDHWHSIFVTDTFQLWIGPQRYMPFNIADVGVSLGAAGLLMFLSTELLRRGPAGGWAKNA
jgi:lipoprotein signal peptidase